MESHANWLSTNPVWSVLGSGTGLWLIHKSGLIKGMPRQSYLRFSHTSLIDLFRSSTLQLITESFWMKLQGSDRGQEGRKQSEKHPSISELPKCFKQGKNPSTVSLSLIFFILFYWQTFQETPAHNAAWKKHAALYPSSCRLMVMPHFFSPSSC